MFNSSLAFREQFEVLFVRFLIDNVVSCSKLIGCITVYRVFLASKFTETNPMHDIKTMVPLVSRFSQINFTFYFKTVYMINIYIDFTI